MKRLISLAALSISISCQYCLAQDPEFDKGFVMHLAFHNGMVTNFSASPDAYIGGLKLQPQITIIPHLLRAGLTADGYYLNKKLQAAAGPVLSIKLKTVKAGIFGSAGNINLQLQHLWASHQQCFAGAEVVADIGNLITLGLGAQRDYHFNNWFFQSELGVRISKKKKPAEPFNQ